MRILITNDDGITAPGLKAAEDIALAIAGPEGEVWTVAPESEQSAVSHCISYTKPMRVTQLGPRRYAVDGSPADCVIMALGHLMERARPDLILSGVNRGFNVAEDISYSGTVAGAREGALQRIRSIALSQAYAVGMDEGDLFEAARRAGPGVVRKVLDMPWDPLRGYGIFYNVNFPPCSGDKVKGVRAARQGRRPDNAFRAQEEVAPNGRAYYWLAHGRGNELCEDDTDARLGTDGWVTVTPLRADVTAHDAIDDVARVLDAPAEIAEA